MQETTEIKKRRLHLGEMTVALEANDGCTWSKYNRLLAQMLLSLAPHFLRYVSGKLKASGSNNFQRLCRCSFLLYLFYSLLLYSTLIDWYRRWLALVKRP